MKRYTKAVVKHELFGMKKEFHVDLETVILIDGNKGLSDENETLGRLLRRYEMAHERTVELDKEVHKLRDELEALTSKLSEKFSKGLW